MDHYYDVLAKAASPGLDLVVRRAQDRFDRLQRRHRREPSQCAFPSMNPASAALVDSSQTLRGPVTTKEMHR